MLLAGGLVGAAPGVPFAVAGDALVGLDLAAVIAAGQLPDAQPGGRPLQYAVGLPGF